MTRTKRNTRTMALQNLKNLKNFAVSKIEFVKDAAISGAGEAQIGRAHV